MTTARMAPWSDRYQTVLATRTGATLYQIATRKRRSTISGWTRKQMIRRRIRVVISQWAVLARSLVRNLRPTLSMWWCGTRSRAILSRSKTIACTRLRRKSHVCTTALAMKETPISKINLLRSQDRLETWKIAKTRGLSRWELKTGEVITRPRTWWSRWFHRSR